MPRRIHAKACSFYSILLVGEEKTIVVWSFGRLVVGRVGRSPETADVVKAVHRTSAPSIHCRRGGEPNDRCPREPESDTPGGDACRRRGLKVPPRDVEIEGERGNKQGGNDAERAELEKEASVE